MRKIFALPLISIIAGCATGLKPVYAPPPPSCINIPGEGCKKISAGNVGGTTLGHNNDEDISPKAAAIPSKP